MISVILPIRNRAGLFERSLRSWAAQTIGRETFELIVIDQDSTDGLRLLLDGYAGSINIRYFNLDPAQGHVPPPPDMKGWTSPAFPQNFGVKRCSGDVIVLTSPETIQASTNLERIEKRTAERGWTFLYGRVINSGSLPADFSYEGLAAVRGEVYCGRERTPQSESLVYFIGAMRKEDFMKLGGIEELFMQGAAYEDTEFGRRVVSAGMTLVLDESILGIHQSHESIWPRPGTRSKAVDRNRDLFNRLDPRRVLANVDRPWGELKDGPKGTQ